MLIPQLLQICGILRLNSVECLLSGIAKVWRVVLRPFQLILINAFKSMLNSRYSFETLSLPKCVNEAVRVRAFLQTQMSLPDMLQSGDHFR